MAADMPPPVQYHIERPAPAADRGAFAALSQSMGAVAQRARDAITPERSGIEKGLPPLDLRSKALTGEDRVALVAGLQANRAGELGKGANAPQSYVGDRIRLAAAYTQAGDAIRQGRSDPAELKAVRCRMVAVTMDGRAGSYLKGGEEAARDARASVSPDVIRECRETAAKARVRQNDGHAADRTSISPTMEHRARTEGRQVRLALHQPAPVRLDLPASHRVSINPQGTQPVRIDPKGSERTRIDPVMHARAAGMSR